jgi:branched-subunit amino acid transport protein
MTEAWVLVIAVGTATVVLKAAGPVFLGRRPLPERIQSMVDLLAPVMLTALVVTQTFGGDGELSLDARVPGVAAAAVAIRLRVPLVGAMVVAALVTSLVRLAG